MKKRFFPVFPILTLLLLLARPALSFEGAQNGLLLWFNVVLPTLLPFMLCSSLLVAWGGVPWLSRPLFPLLAPLGISREGCYALLAGLLCGYPMGAKTTADFCRAGKVGPREGRLLLALAGCPSPMFLAGYVRTHLDPAVSFPLLLAAIYLPLPFLGAAAATFYRVREEKNGTSASGAPGTALPVFPVFPVAGVPESDTPVSSSPAAARLPAPPASFDTVLMDCLAIMVRIGGYIMVYSILAAFAGALLPPAAGARILGVIEMTTGIEAISHTLSGREATAAIAAAAAFGGLSGVSQTGTVIKNAGLSIRHYIFWKLIHASLAWGIILLLSPP